MLVGILGVFALMVVVCVALFNYWCQDLPSTDNIMDYQNSNTTTVYAADKTTVLAKFFLQDRQPIDLDEMGDTVIGTTLATEDNRFYNHGAIDPIGVARALVNNLTGSSRQGASTITQQLVRNTVLADEASEATLKRKVREAALAIELENQLSKDDILMLYLNTINYGDNCYGIEAAAKHYFSKHAKNLTVLEAATLVGIPQSPTSLTPTTHPKACKNRRNVVLQRLADTGRISQEEADSLKEEPLNLDVDSSGNDIDGIYKYPYFTSYVRDTLLENLGTEDVYEGGLTVYTTLDTSLQEDAEKACQAQYDAWGYDNGAEIALVSIDPSNGYIKALVGGKNYRNDQFNLVTQASRQAGSSFKAFTLTTAIEEGINPATMLNCTSPAQLGNWRVENINNVNYGIRSIQSAFAVSSNTGFARLIQAVGADKVAALAKRCGISSTLDEVDSLTLGTSGVTPLEMCGAFATFANGGTQRTPTAVTQVLDRDGNTVYEWKDTGTKALSDEVCSAAVKVMRTVFTQGTAVAAQLTNGQEAAGKTGTSESYRDHWLCGYTPQLSTTVWMGSRQEKSLPGLDCCYVWRTYMEKALTNSPHQSFATAADPSYNSEYNSNGQLSGSNTGSGSSSSSSSASTNQQWESSSSGQNATSSSTATSSSSNHYYVDNYGRKYVYDDSTGNYTYTDSNGDTYEYDESAGTITHKHNS
ncbi:MAG: transglycosylase domain-containing protein [Eggerthellaceae bacterium]